MSNGNSDPTFISALHTSAQSTESKLINPILNSASYQELVAAFTHAMDAELQVSTASEHMSQSLIQEI